MKKCLTNFDLKLIALIMMTIDHFAVLFHPFGYPFLRSMGRLSFPIFAFLLVEGYIHTKNFKKYISRIFLLALISEIIDDYVFSKQIINFSINNIFFTLGFGLIVLYLIDKSTLIIEKYVKEKIDFYIIKYLVISLIVLTFSFFSFILNISYDIYGILLISLLYIFKDKKLILYLSIILITILYPYPLQIFSLFAFLLIYFYNGKLGRKSKYFFYLYYPSHLIVLYLLSLLG